MSSTNLIRDTGVRLAREFYTLGRLPDPHAASWKGLRSAVLDFVSDLLAQTTQLKPPVDLVPVAALRCIHDIGAFLARPSPEAALIPSGGGFIVRLRPGISETRRRFSLAHEIAHTFFYDLGNRPPVRYLPSERGLSEGKKEEGICNAAAAELLMPKAWVSADLDKVHLGGLDEMLPFFANRYAVSIEVAARRLLKDFDIFPTSAVVIPELERADNEGSYKPRKILGNISYLRRDEKKLLDCVIFQLQSGAIPSDFTGAVFKDGTVVCQRRLPNGGIWISFIRQQRKRASNSEESVSSRQPVTPQSNVVSVVLRRSVELGFELNGKIPIFLSQEAEEELVDDFAARMIYERPALDRWRR